MRLIVMAAGDVTGLLNDIAAYWQNVKGVRRVYVPLDVELLKELTSMSIDLDVNKYRLLNYALKRGLSDVKARVYAKQ